MNDNIIMLVAWSWPDMKITYIVVSTSIKGENAKFQLYLKRLRSERGKPVGGGGLRREG